MVFFPAHNEDVLGCVARTYQNPKKHIAPIDCPVLGGRQGVGAPPLLPNYDIDSPRTIPAKQINFLRFEKTFFFFFELQIIC